MLATAPTRTLDHLLAELLDDAATGHGATCLVCSEPAMVVRRGSGRAWHECRSCGSVLEDDEPAFQSGPFPLD